MQIVAHPNMQEIANIGPQHDRARSFAVFEPDVAMRKAFGQGLVDTDVLIAICCARALRYSIGGCQIPTQSKDHAKRIEGTEAVIDQNLIKRCNIGANNPPRFAVLI